MIYINRIIQWYSEVEVKNPMIALIVFIGLLMVLDVICEAL